MVARLVDQNAFIDLIQSTATSNDHIALIFFYQFDDAEISSPDPQADTPSLIKAAGSDNTVTIAEYNSAVYTFARDLYGIDAQKGVLFARFGQFAAYHEGFEQNVFEAKLAKVKMMTRQTLDMFPLEIRAASLRAAAADSTAAVAQTLDDAPATTLETHPSDGCCVIL
ncbi:hypothetical protein LPJ73_001842 [Coemansia sp. RSA 2703]|nr:hypothetical protein LPJ73_001842 [Coemansia sp. RSA 2703]KAJ2371239.1 hypothetical protein IW150_004685 [Coemansia sp. RSA 2607]KAJ2395447.1 hypothetical protein GGI05_001579 [Coemansia sp. RSA 2603]